MIFALQKRSSPEQIVPNVTYHYSQGIPSSYFGAWFSAFDYERLIVKYKIYCLLFRYLPFSHYAPPKQNELVIFCRY